MTMFGNEPAAGLATVQYGANVDHDEHAGKTIAQLRTEFRNVWMMKAKVTALNDEGVQLEDNYVVQPGDEIEFLPPVGEKG